MAVQQEVDLGIKVDFLIKCFHRSGIYVRLAFSETPSAGGSKACCAGSRAEAFTNWQPQRWYLRIKIWPCSPQIWQADTGCKGFHSEMFSLHQSAAITAEAQKAASECCECWNGSFRGKTSCIWSHWRGGLKAKRKLSFLALRDEIRKRRGHCGSLRGPAATAVSLGGRGWMPLTHTWNMLESIAQTRRIRFGFPGTRSRESHRRLLAMQIHAVLQRG